MSTETDSTSSLQCPERHLQVLLRAPHLFLPPLAAIGEVLAVESPPRARGKVAFHRGGGRSCWCLTEQRRRRRHGSELVATWPGIDIDGLCDWPPPADEGPRLPALDRDHLHAADAPQRQTRVLDDALPQ